MSKDALEKAIGIVGTASALAELIGISKGAISQWKDAGRRIPAEHCPAIERATGGRVRCEELRPDVDWACIRGIGTHLPSGSECSSEISGSDHAGHPGRQPPSPTNILDTVPAHSVVLPAIPPSLEPKEKP